MCSFEQRQGSQLLDIWTLSIVQPDRSIARRPADVSREPYEQVSQFSTVPFSLLKEPIITWSPLHNINVMQSYNYDYKECMLIVHLDWSVDIRWYIKLLVITPWVGIAAGQRYGEARHRDLVISGLVHNCVPYLLSSSRLGTACSR
jgi:hypothetical protein